MKSIDRLFSGIPNPIEAQSLFNTWRSGLVAEVERLTPSMLPTALLVANVSRLTFRTDVVDDYSRLLERVQEEYQRDVPRFWHPECFLVASLALNHGVASNYCVDETPDGEYVREAVKFIFEF